MNLNIQKITRKLSFSSIILIVVLLLDVLLYVGAKQGYYLTAFKPSGAIIPICITLIAFYIFIFHTLKRKIVWSILVTILVLPIIGWFWLLNLFMENSYETITSPSGEEVVLIEHRDATLGETTHFYYFYRETFFPGVIHQLNEETVSIMTRGTNADNLEVLGIDHAIWYDDQVIFSSPFAETKVEWKARTKATNHADNPNTAEKTNQGDAFTPKESDVIQSGDRAWNTAVMDAFIKDTENETESEIRYVLMDDTNTAPIAVYSLKYRIDAAAEQSWIDVVRDYSFGSDDDDVMKPQQCSSISKDMERGAYYLNECFHTWEIKLMPIVEQ